MQKFLFVWTYFRAFFDYQQLIGSACSRFKAPLERYCVYCSSRMKIIFCAALNSVACLLPATRKVCGFLIIMTSLVAPNGLNHLEQTLAKMTYSDFEREL